MKRGFTLIELLVVVAVIVIISAVIIANISSSRQKSRDARKISDIGQIQLALEQYYDRCGVYPDKVTNPPSASANGTCPVSGVSLASFISVVPTSPTSINYVYAIKGDKSDYVLRASLEVSGNSVMSNSLGTILPAQQYWGPSSYSYYWMPIGTVAPTGVSILACNNLTLYCVGPK